MQMAVRGSEIGSTSLEGRIAMSAIFLEKIQIIRSKLRVWKFHEIFPDIKKFDSKTDKFSKYMWHELSEFAKNRNKIDENFARSKET